MPKYAGQLQINSNTKLKDLTSLQELPRIFVNVTKAIGMFVDIWLGKIDYIYFCFKSNQYVFFVFIGKDIDLNCLYSPKPSNNSTVTMNDNTTSSGNSLSQTRPLAQSVRGNPTLGTLKPTKSQADNRRGNIQQIYFLFKYPILFQLVLRKQV